MKLCSAIKELIPFDPTTVLDQLQYHDLNLVVHNDGNITYSPKINPAKLKGIEINQSPKKEPSEFNSYFINKVKIYTNGNNEFVLSGNQCINSFAIFDGKLIAISFGHNLKNKIQTVIFDDNEEINEISMLHHHVFCPNHMKVDNGKIIPEKWIIDDKSYNDQNVDYEFDDVYSRYGDGSGLTYDEAKSLFDHTDKLLQILPNGE